MSTQPITILLIEDNPADVFHLREMLAEAGGAAFALEHAPTLEAGLQRLSAGGIEIVLLDLNLTDSRGYETFELVNARVPDIPVVLLTGLADEEMALRAVRSGAQEYLVKGRITSPALLRVIRYSLERHKARLEQAHAGLKEGKVIAFLAAKGGTGTTTVVLNTALLLNKQKSVLVVELCAGYGAFPLYLRHSQGRSLADLLELTAEGITPPEVKARLAQTKFGFQALFSAGRSDRHVPVQAGQAGAIVRAARTLADYVLVTLPPQVSEAHQEVIRNAERLILVVDREPVSVAAGKRLISAVQQWGLPPSAIEVLVVNRSALSSSMSLTDVASLLGCGVLGVVPSAADACAQAFSAGTLVAAAKPDSNIAAALAELSAKLTA